MKNEFYLGFLDRKPVLTLSKKEFIEKVLGMSRKAADTVLEKRQEGGTLAKTEVQPPLHHKISLKHKD